MALDHWWELDGWAVGRGLPDLRELSLDRWCNFVRWWATKNAEDPNDVAKFEARLFRPPPGQAATIGPWTAEAEQGAFAALKTSLG